MNCRYGESAMWAISGSQNAVWIGGNVWRVMGPGYLRGAADIRDDDVGVAR